MDRLVLSIFPGLGIMEAAFEAAGFTVLRGPDLLWGGDIKSFYPPPNVFRGVIGGIPCQAHSALLSIMRAKGNRVAENMTPEFERVVAEACPQFWMSENIVRAPIPSVPGHTSSPVKLNGRWFGRPQNREHVFTFGWHGPDALKPRFRLAALESADYAYRVTSTTSGRPVKFLKGGKEKYTRADGTKSRGGELGRMRLSVAECAELQGLPRTFFDKCPFTQDSLRKMLANAVPYYLALEVARGLARALGVAFDDGDSSFHDHRVWPFQDEVLGDDRNSTADPQEADDAARVPADER